MKRLVHLLFFILILAIGNASSAHALEGAKHNVIGDFELTGFFSAGMGWQKFAGGTPTEAAYDGSYAGVMGSVIPPAVTGIAQYKGENFTEAFVEVLELDIIKKFGKRTRFRADLLFGRISSGSWPIVPGTDIEQAYAAVTLSDSPYIEFSIGRIETRSGFEASEPYNSDTISWSILSRAVLYPAIITGAELTAQLNDNFTIYLAAANSLTNDSTIKIQEAPSVTATFEILWGEDHHRNYFLLSPFFGPESNSNRPFSFGADATLVIWPMEKLQMGLEALYRRDNAKGGPDTDYAAGLINIHWDFTEKIFGALRYSFAKQFDEGNGVLNLTGARQQIHEASLAGGYQITDGMKLKLEARLDAVNPSVGDTQWVPGMAMALCSAF